MRAYRRYRLAVFSWSLVLVEACIINLGCSSDKQTAPETNAPIAFAMLQYGFRPDWENLEEGFAAFGCVHSEPRVDSVSVWVNDARPDSAFQPGDSEVFLFWGTMGSGIFRQNYSGGDVGVMLRFAQGYVTGSVRIPTSFRVVDAPSAVRKGSDVVVTWESDADFYAVDVHFGSYDPEHGVRYVNLTSELGLPASCTPEQSLEIPGNLLDRDGTLHISVIPECGVLPAPRAKANMTGSCPGFLYSFNEFVTGGHIDVKVGTGMDSSYEGTQHGCGPEPYLRLFRLLRYAHQ